MRLVFYEQAYEIPDFVRFKAPVTGFDFWKWSHHHRGGGETAICQFLLYLI